MAGEPTSTPTLPTSNDTGDLRASLSAAFDSADAAAATPEPVQTPAADAAPLATPGADPAQDGRARGPDGKFIAKTESTEAPAAPVTPEAGDPSPVVPPASDALTAPQHWKAEDKAAFEKLAPEGRSLLLEQSKRMEAAHTRRVQELGEIAKVGDVLAPLSDQMRQAGYTPTSWVTMARDTQVALMRDPVGTLAGLAKAYGADPTKLAAALGAPSAAPVAPSGAAPGATPADPNADPKWTDPDLAAVRAELGELKSAVQQRQEAEARAAQAAEITKMQTFAAEKTDTGDPAHPYFDDVLSDMLDLARIERSRDRQPTLKDLYDRAVRMNPSVWDKVEAAKGAAATAKAELERKAKLAQATRAGASINGAPGASTAPNPERSLREEIAAGFR